MALHGMGGICWGGLWGGGGPWFENEICLKIFSRTARFRCLKFGTCMHLLLVVLYQVCSNSGSRVQNVPAPGVVCLSHRNT